MNDRRSIITCTINCPWLERITTSNIRRPAAILLLLACALRAAADQPSKLRRQQSVAETSRHLTSTEDESRQCGTSFAFHHKDTNRWLPASISSMHHSNPCSPEMVMQGPLLSWKIQTWLPNCGVIHWGKVDHLSRLPVFFPLTSDVHTYQILPQRHAEGW